jgi:hypothetical protein
MELTARQIVEEYDKHSGYFECLINGKGIYFKLYGDSVIPFYIGISENMLNRNQYHISQYKPGGEYWLVKEVQRLRNAELFYGYVNDKTKYDEVFHRSYADDEGRARAYNDLYENMRVVFARIVCDNEVVMDMDVIERVEGQLLNYLEKAGFYKKDMGWKGGQKVGDYALGFYQSKQYVDFSRFAVHFESP